LKTLPKQVLGSPLLAFELPVKTQWQTAG